MSKSPLVTAYWVTGFRSDYLESAINSFLRSTDYDNLELIIVDFSIGDIGAPHRKNLAKLEEKAKVIYIEEISCMWSNSNLAFENSEGDYILHFEDDILFSEETPKQWIQQCIEDLVSKAKVGIGAINLFSSNLDHPQSVAFMSTRKVREEWHPWESYPLTFSSVTESMLLGDKNRIQKFFDLGYRVISKDYVLTSLNAPSVNLVKIREVNDLTFKEADDLVANGHFSKRDSRTRYISGSEYTKKGGWKGFEISIVYPHGEPDVLFSKRRALLHQIKAFVKRIIKR